jgi:hypothetical protein
MDGCVPCSPVVYRASGGRGNPAMSDAARSTSPSIRNAASASAVLAAPSIVGPDVGRMFTDLSTPAVRSIAPSEGPASDGTRATLAGSFFVPVTAVRIGGVTAPFIAVTSPPRR